MWFIERTISVRGKKRKVYSYNSATNAGRNIPILNQYLSELLSDQKVPNKRSIRFITKSIRNNIKNGFRYIYIADINRFFDSIPHAQLLSLLEPIMNQNKFHCLREALQKFSTVIGKDCGLPTGISMANSLSELYLFDLDKKMYEISGANDFYYDRYVDNFILMFQNTSKTDLIIDDIINEFQQNINSKELKLNYLENVGSDHNNKNFK